MPTLGNQNEELILKSITMKRTTVTLSTIAIALLTITVISCKDGKKETNDKEGAHMEMGTEEGHHHESSAGEMDHGTMDHEPWTIARAPPPPPQGPNSRREVQNFQRRGRPRRQGPGEGPVA